MSRAASGLAKLLKSALSGKKALQLRIFNHPEIIKELKAGGKLVDGVDSLTPFKGGVKVKLAAKGGTVKDVFVNLSKTGADGLSREEAAKLWPMLKPILDAEPGIDVGEAVVRAIKGGNLTLKTKSPLLSRAASRYGKALQEHPIATSAATLAGGGFLANEMLDSLGNTRLLEDEIKTTFAERDAISADALRNERLRKSAALNEVELARRNPQLYTEVISGRRLPRGAVVFGGKPRRDMMEELTMAMASGQFRPEPSLEERALSNL